MTGKRQWLDVEGVSLGEDCVYKKFAACCAVSETPAVVSCSENAPCHPSHIYHDDVRSLVLVEVDVIPPSSSAEPLFLSPRKDELLIQQKPQMDRLYRKNLFQYIRQSTGHGVLPERVSLKDIVHICHSAWNPDEDDDDSDF